MHLTGQWSVQLNTFLSDLGNALQTALGRNLVALYVYGSLTQDAFDPRRSDVDCVALIRHGLRSKVVARLRRELRRQDGPWLRRLQLTILVSGELLRVNGRGMALSVRALEPLGVGWQPDPLGEHPPHRARHSRAGTQDRCAADYKACPARRPPPRTGLLAGRVDYQAKQHVAGPVVVPPLCRTDDVSHPLHLCDRARGLKASCCNLGTVTCSSPTPGNCAARL